MKFKEIKKEVMDVALKAYNGYYYSDKFSLITIDINYYYYNIVRQMLSWFLMTIFKKNRTEPNYKNEIKSI